MNALKREFPLISLMISFLILFFMLFYFLPKNKMVLEEKQISKEILQNGFVQSFSLNDLWIKNNEGKRELEPLLNFINAKIPGLHFCFQEYLSKNKVLKKEFLKSNEKIMLGLYVNISESGKIDSTKVIFSESKYKNFNVVLETYVKKYWVYKKASRNTEFIFPIRFRAKSE